MPSPTNTPEPSPADSATQRRRRALPESPAPRVPVQRSGAARRFQRPVPASIQLPPPAEAATRHWPEQASLPAPPPRDVAAGPDAQYVRGLEAQLRTLSAAVESLEQQLAGYAERNRELEAAQSQLAGHRAASDRDATRRAAEELRAAEARAGAITAAAQQRAERLEHEAKARSIELIEAVGSEIEQLEREAQRIRNREQQAGAEAAASERPGNAPRGLAVVPDPPDAQESQAPGDEAGFDPARIRGEIGDLLRLRESILTSLRGAITGFDRELETLAEPPSAPAAAQQPGIADGSRSVTPAAADGENSSGSIEILAEPVAGVLEASQIEQQLSEHGGAEQVHLRSVEGTTAVLRVTGLGAEQLRSAISARFPAAKTELAGEDRILMRLSPAPAAPATEAG